MLRPRRRLFRRRASWEWITENAYAGVALLALAAAAVGWMAQFPQSRYAPADLAARSMPAAGPLPATANEPSAAGPTPLPSTTDTTVPVTAAKTKPSLASIGPAPRAAGGTLEASGRRVRQWNANSKSHPVARSSRRARSSSAAAVGNHHARVRWPRVSARHRNYASATRAGARAHKEYLDRSYDSRALSEKSAPPPQDAASSADNKTERAINPTDCSRVYHVFGGVRRVRSQCPAGDASIQAE